MRSFKRNQQGLLNYYVVVVLALVVCGIMWFFLANGVQAVQSAFNLQFASTNFASENNFATFDLANTFVNNIWVFFLVFLVLGLGYYGYIEAQRRN